MLRIKELRKERGITQQTIAEVLEISRVAYSKKERGITQYNHNDIIKLANFFGMSAGYLLGIEERKKNPL